MDVAFARRGICYATWLRCGSCEASELNVTWIGAKGWTQAQARLSYELGQRVLALAYAAHRQDQGDL